MTSLHNLPQRQREVLHFIIREIEEKDQSPTIKEIANHIGILEQQVHQCLKALKEKNRITWDKFKQRSITVIDDKKGLIK